MIWAAGARHVLPKMSRWHHAGGQVIPKSALASPPSAKSRTSLYNMNCNLNSSTSNRDDRFLIWIVAIAFVVVSGGFFSLLSGHPEGTWPPLDAGYALFVQYGIVVVATGCTFIRLLQRPSLLIRGFWLLAVPLMPLASILWSQNYYETFRATMLFYAPLFSSLAIAFYFSPAAIVRIAIRVTIITILSSVAVIILFPAYGIHNITTYDITWTGAWRGIFTHKNGFGGALGICLILLIMVQRMWLPTRLALLTLTIVSLVYSHSASPIAFSLCAFIAAAFISPQCFSGPGTLILRSVGIVLLFVFCVSIFAGQNELPLGIFSRDLTLSGRTPVWFYVLDQLNWPLLFGLGYVTGYEEILYPAISQLFGPEFHHVHNGFLDTYIGLGLVGLSLFLFLALSALRNAIWFVKSDDPNFRDLGRAAVVLILFSLLSSWTEVTLSRPGNSIFPMSFLFIATIIVNRQRRVLSFGDTSTVKRQAKRTRMASELI